MVGLLAPTFLAIALAVALGGSLRSLVDTGIRWWPAILAAFAIELVLYKPPVDRQAWALTFGPWLWLATRSMLLGVLVLNAASARTWLAWAWWLAAGGVALNSVVIALNDGHMPQSLEAAAAVWGPALFVDSSRLQNVAPIHPGTLLPWLGDVFAEPRWLPRPNVISLGDMLLAMGVACWAFGATASPVQFRSRIVGLFQPGRRINGPARPTRRCSS